MALIVVGLGNTGAEYEKTRHNAGRLAVSFLAKKEGYDDFSLHKKSHALIAQGLLEGKKTTFVLPETMMNASGKAVSAFIKTPTAAKNLLVVHDDLDLPLGTIKAVFGRGAGGHKGVESIMRAIKTKDFVRVRIGIAPPGRAHEAKKLKDTQRVIKHVMGKFRPAEEVSLKKALTKASATIRLFAKEGREAAIQFSNTR